MFSITSYLGLLVVFLSTRSYISCTRTSQTEKKADQYENYEHWNDLGRKELDEALDVFRSINTNVAKNIILFIGDGMSLTTLTASRIYKAQFKGRQEGTHVNGEESSLTFQTFPHTALSKTYCVDRQTPDSSSTASAIYSGVKTKFKTMGYDTSIIYKNVSSQLTATKVDTILKWAQDANKDTGFVTTARVSHATPAALYAHVASRDYECDTELPPNSPPGVTDITYQLVNNDPGRKIKVVMGGGLKSWMSKEEHQRNWKQDPYEDHDHTKDKTFDCERLDGRNLVDTFLRKNRTVPGFENKKGKMVKTRDELLRLDPLDTDYVLGLFSDGHMQYEDVRQDKQTQPSLPEMTKAAINILKKNKENGFFLMVEQSNIDHAHHKTRASASLLETMILDDAVETALSLVDTDDTLIIVTSDHSHTMTMAGYQTRGSDIRGLVDSQKGSDGVPYTILGYATGPAFNTHLSVDDSQRISRFNLSGQEDVYKSFSFQNPVSAPLKSETHGGDDVGIFAVGPYAHLFHSVHEQSYIGHVMAYSGCLGPYKKDPHCVVKNSVNRIQNSILNVFSVCVLLIGKQFLFN